LLCYKNGSLTRELVRDASAKGDWESFNFCLDNSPPGNSGFIGFFFKEFEITPKAAAGFHRFDQSDLPIAKFPTDATEVRAVVEGQFLSMLLHSRAIGLHKASRIYATGGASRNRHILQVVSDVFGVPVFTLTQPNSASLGAAYRALHGWQCHNAGDTLVSFDDTVQAGPLFQKEVDPNMDVHKTYEDMVGRYEKLEQQILNQ